MTRSNKTVQYSKMKFQFEKIRPQFSLISLSKIFFYAFIIAKPFYLGESGSFQVGDFCLMISFLFLLVARGLSTTLERSDGWLVCFVGLTFIVNGVYAVLYGNAGIFGASFMYVYNLLAVIVFAYHVKDRAFLKTTIILLRLDLLVQFSISVFGFGRVYGGSRYMGTFNDPNQFAVFVFFAFLLIKMGERKLETRSIFFDDVIALLLIYQSVSVGMFLGFGVYYICLAVNSIFFSRLSAGKWLVLAFLGVALCIGGLVVGLGVTSVSSQLFDSGFAHRFINKLDGGSLVSSYIADRQLTKVLEYPEYLIFGSGEGFMWRFATSGPALEIHSTPIGIIFYYGLIPSIILAVWIASKIKNGRGGCTWVFLIPLLIECLTLANQRQPLFWMLLVLVGVQMDVGHDNLSASGVVGVPFHRRSGKKVKGCHVGYIYDTSCHDGIQGTISWNRYYDSNFCRRAGGYGSASSFVAFCGWGIRVCAYFRHTTTSVRSENVVNTSSRKCISSMKVRV